MLADNFENPDEFIPERFMDKTYSPFQYLPFGAGQRRCLGEKLALAETKWTACEIIRSFDYGLVDGYYPDLIQVSYPHENRSTHRHMDSETLQTSS